MTAHDHTTLVDGCHRCELNRDEMRRPLGELTADDLGSEIAVVHKGRLYVGTLGSVEHKLPWSGDGPPKTSISLVGDDGWRWHGFMESTDTLVDPPPKVSVGDAS